MAEVWFFRKKGSVEPPSLGSISFGSNFYPITRIYLDEGKIWFESKSISVRGGPPLIVNKNGERTIWGPDGQVVLHVPEAREPEWHEASGGGELIIRQDVGVEIEHY